MNNLCKSSKAGAKRRIRLVIVLILILLAGFIMFQFPHLYFKKQFSYKNFVIYSNDELNKEEVLPILNIVHANIVNSAFYQEEQSFKLIFVGGSSYQKILHWLGVKNMAFSKYNTHIYNGYPDFKSNVLVAGTDPLELLNLEQLIAHECVHSQMYKEHSLFGFMQTPHWVNEGYSEYISYTKPRRSKAYTLTELWTTLQVDNNQWLKTSYGHYSPREYVEALMMIEYLIETKKMTIEEIIANDTINPYWIKKEMAIEMKNK
ncbi:collagenase [uncultured Aquimarina sp.]|uniref:collagenase n=1 Tax=uncultured Aquimarina sp. TaxID=575652 RepID=UPI002602AA02|nr:collagenase [uncultured Aquimarina sp.]